MPFDIRRRYGSTSSPQTAFVVSSHMFFRSQLDWTSSSLSDLYEILRCDQKDNVEGLTFLQ
jgi:hypothetical protein